MDIVKDSLALTGTGITTSYQGGAAVPAGRATKVRVIGKSVTLAASNSTSMELKLQASADGTTEWTDVKTADDVDVDAAKAAEHTKNTGSSKVIGMWLSVPAGFPFLRVAGKYTGGAGKAGESLTGQLQLLA